MSDPYSFESSALNWKFRAYQELALHDPRATLKISNVVGDPVPKPNPLFGIEVREVERMVDRPMVIQDGNHFTFVLPKFNRYGERTGVQALDPPPFWTRHMLGVREGARARRREWG